MFCFREDKLSVRVGTPIRKKGGQTANIIDACINPKYNPKAVDYDEGVGKLDRHLVLNILTKLIVLQPKGVEVPDKSIGTVAGWGVFQNKINDTQLPKMLQEIQYNKINHEICKATSFIPVSDRMTCFGSGIGSKSSCNVIFTFDIILQSLIF